MKQAVIYCRVSSDRQATEGHGLSSQERACRKYADEQGFEVLKVFTDDTTGGGDFWKRPGIRELLDFLEEQDASLAVIFDDLKRFARDTMFHLKLRQELAARNATPRCPNFRFDESPEGLFVETVIAATAELERKQNRRQVISRMQARLEAGYWVFSPPLGYRFEKRDGEKLVVLDHPRSERVREALEDFASGKLPTLESVADFLRSENCFSSRSGRTSISKQSIRKILENEFYTGWCVCKKWDLRVRGRHQALITPKTRRRILRRLEKLSTRPHVVRPHREDFPLRGQVLCLGCELTFTSGWSRGRSKRYPYYQCRTPGCAGAVPKKMMEEQFVERLEDATPKSFVFRLFDNALSELFRDTSAIIGRRRKQRDKRLAEIGEEIDGLLESLGRAKSAKVRSVYEERIDALASEQQELEDEPVDDTSSLDFEPVLDEGRELLENPVRYWKNGNLDRRLKAQNLVFEAPIPYRRKTGFRTAGFTLFYELFRESERSGTSMVELIGPDSNPVAEELKRWRKVLRI